MVLQEYSQFIISALLWLLLRQSCTPDTLLRDGPLRAGGGLRGLQTDDMVSEHGCELYHSNHLLPGNNVMVNQYTIHHRHAKPNTCQNPSPMSFTGKRQT